MKPLWRMLLLTLLTLTGFGTFLAACGNDDGGAAGDGLSVVVSTSIIAALTEQVGGDRLQVETLIAPGVDPHTFEMTPGDARALTNADLVLINGLELDDYLIEDVESAIDEIEVIVITAGIELREANGRHAHEDEHDHGAFDPHVWQDPLRVKAMVTNIADALAGADPDNAAEYRDNAADYRATLDTTHAEIQALIDEIPAERRKLVTNHESIGYFADRYGLEIVGTVIPGGSSEADPSAGDIADLTALIEAEGVRAIFAEALIDPVVADALAADTGIEIVHGLYSDQVGEPGSGAETVHGMLLANAARISKALR